MNNNKQTNYNPNCPSCPIKVACNNCDKEMTCEEFKEYWNKAVIENGAAMGLPYEIVKKALIREKKQK